MASDEKSAIREFKVREFAELQLLRTKLSQLFCLSYQDYMKMEANLHHNLTLELQEYSHSIQFTKLFLDLHITDIQEILGYESFSYQSKCYLRATRPNSDGRKEFVGFHRESFFHEMLSHCYNIWIPLVSITENNALYYIPQSQKIPLNQIMYVNEGEEFSSIKKYSNGHKVGLNYDNFVINSGVELSKKRRMLVTDDHYLIFSGNLIHGAAQNLENYIRFSIDFEIIPTHNAIEYNNFSSGGEFFSKFKM